MPAGVAPAYVVTAAFDPLRDEGEAYAEKLARAGVDVQVHRAEGQIHGFIGLVGVSRAARTATQEIADVLCDRLSLASVRPIDGPTAAH